MTQLIYDMDPYLDTIPDDRGEEIKNRVMERDGSDSEGRPTKRARADTSAILPPGNDPPQPEIDLNNYDRERLQKGLTYITEAAKKKITPRTQEFLKLHKDAYEVALKHQASVEASRAVVQAMDEVHYSAAFYLKPRSSEEYDRFKLYLNLRWLEFMANYSDYVGKELQEVRAKLKAVAIGGSFGVQEVAPIALEAVQSWLDIADELGGEGVGNFRKDVDVACAVLGIDSSHMEWLIKEWAADKNRIFHSQVRQYISDCHWVSLAEQICRDLKELLNVGPPDMVKEYEKVLLCIRDEYFDVMSRDDPQHWIPNEKARKLIVDKLARDEKRAQK